MRSIVWWTALTSGACENLTLTWVPPRKSMSSGIPCQNTMESTPATLKISEKAMKYHFLPRKSIFALLKNSTLPGPFQNLKTCHSERARLRAGEESYVTLNPQELNDASALTPLQIPSTPQIADAPVRSLSRPLSASEFGMTIKNN